MEWWIADLHIPAVHMPRVHYWLWFLGVPCRTPVSDLPAVGALHPWQLNAQRPCGQECYRWVYSDVRSSLFVIRHRSQHRRAYLTLRQVNLSH